MTIARVHCPYLVLSFNLWRCTSRPGQLGEGIGQGTGTRSTFGRVRAATIAVPVSSWNRSRVLMDTQGIKAKGAITVPVADPCKVSAMAVANSRKHRIHLHRLSVSCVADRLCILHVSYVDDVAGVGGVLTRSRGRPCVFVVVHVSMKLRVL